MCMSVSSHMLPVSGNISLFVMSVFLANENSSSVGNENFLLSLLLLLFLLLLFGGVVRRWRVCTRLDGLQVIAELY